jgi:hypothetical protein
MLKDEIKFYKDKLGYVNPYVVSQTQERQSDNCTMYTSEYAIMLAKNLQNTPEDDNEWEELINKSMLLPGLLARYPGYKDQDSVDNMVGVLAASKVLNKPEVAESIFQYGLRHLGFFNTEIPGDFEGNSGKINWASMLWRQPQLIFAALCASGRQKWWKIYQLPLAIYTALVIAVGGKNEPINSTDPRRLNWLLSQAVNNSLLCRLASKVFFNRCYKDYNVTENFMREVAARYYQLGHPFVRYWID